MPAVGGQACDGGARLVRKARDRPGADRIEPADVRQIQPLDAARVRGEPLGQIAQIGERQAARKMQRFAAVGLAEGRRIAHSPATMKDNKWIGNNMRAMRHAMHRLAIYDMDKTITRRAAWTPFLASYARRRRWGFLSLLATLGPVGLYLGKRIDRARLKEMTQALVMGRRAKLEAVAEAAGRFGGRVAGDAVRSDARARIVADQAAGYRGVRATAS